MPRTDRNNNPTAFTTDVAKDAGLVVGVDYEVGDPFTVPGQFGPITYHTAKLLGNPIELTLRAITHATFFTAHGGPRWPYIGIPKFIWEKLTRDVQVEVIGWMYGHEGGIAMRSLFPAAPKTAPPSH